MRSRRLSPRGNSPISGARVIKIERPGAGDFARGYDERVRGHVLLFRLVQPLEGEPDARCQTSRSAQPSARSLLAEADVLVQNLAPGAAARLGLSYETLHAAASPTDRLRHFGLRRRRSLSRQEGLRSADSERGRISVGHRHSRSAVQKPDAPSPTSRRACMPYSNILAALLNRGQHRARAAASTCRCWNAWWNGWVIRCTMLSKARRRRRAPGLPMRRSIHTGRSSPETARPCMLGLQNEREWAVFCDKVLQQPELAADPRFSTNTRRSNARARTARHHRGSVLAPDLRTGDRPARRCANRQCPRERYARLVGASATQGPLPLDRSRYPRRAHPRAPAARHDGSEHGPGARARPTQPKPS